jgi:hypothetical protein
LYEKLILTDEGIRYAEHATPSTRKSRHHFAGSGGSSVCIVRLRTKTTNKTQTNSVALSPRANYTDGLKPTEILLFFVRHTAYVFCAFLTVGFQNHSALKVMLFPSSVEKQTLY